KRNISETISPRWSACAAWTSTTNSSERLEWSGCNCEQLLKGSEPGEKENIREAPSSARHSTHHVAFDPAVNVHANRGIGVARDGRSKARRQQLRQATGLLRSRSRHGS